MDTARHDDCSDEVLMARYARGDAEAFNALFVRYEARVYGFMLRRVKSESLAADLYQEFFLRIHSARESYDASRPFAPWCFQIARRLVIDEYRRCGRRREEALDAEISADVQGVEVDERVACHERAEAVLAQLSEIERYVLISAKVDGRHYNELAAELGKSVVAIKKLASRAMQRLRAIPEYALREALPARS